MNAERLLHALSDAILCEKGAGTTRCVADNCTKIGIPVCLYDSHPNETDSLYLRSGLCFTCQRDLNEKRRTERKRPSSTQEFASSSPSLLYAIGPCQKKFKLNGNTILLNSDAVIVNGSIDGAKQYGDDYGFQEIGGDLQGLAREASADVERLINAVSGSTTADTVSAEPLTAEAAASAVVEASSGLLLSDGQDPSSSTSNINTLYDKAFKSLNKAIFLLSQWKVSWDAAVETSTDPTLAEAVASAAAVVAAASDSHDQASNMVSLLLAADQRNEVISDEAAQASGEQFVEEV